MLKMVAHLPPLVFVKETEFSSMEGGGLPVLPPEQRLLGHRSTGG